MCQAAAINYFNVITICSLHHYSEFFKNANTMAFQFDQQKAVETAGRTTTIKNVVNKFHNSKISCHY